MLDSKLVAWGLIVVLSLLVALLTTVTLQQIPSNIAEGMITSRDIKADRDYEVIDEEATNAFRNEAIAGVLPVLRHGSTRWEKLQSREWKKLSPAFANVSKR